MKQPIRDAIDESLSGVHFNVSDMRSVLRATRIREEEPARPPRRRPLHLDLAFACAMLLILVVPLSLFALRTRSTQTTHIVAAPGSATALPQATLATQADTAVGADSVASTQEESEAIRIARACFEAECDTSIFTFEEYAVSVTHTGDGEQTRRYTVNMTSIYGNGCSFSVVIDMPEGTIVQFSTPQLATMPTYLDTDSPEIQAWYTKYGPYLFTWAPEDQAEFSRRYEGGALRLPEAGELTFEEAQALTRDYVRTNTGYEGELAYVYPMLYAQSADTPASYVVYCCETAVTDTLPAQSISLNFSATGENIQILSDSLTPASGR